MQYTNPKKLKNYRPWSILVKSLRDFFSRLFFLFKKCWKKKCKLVFGMGLSPLPKKNIQGPESFLGLVEPSRNRLVSTAYQKKPGFSVLHATSKYIFFLKWSNLYDRSGIGWIERKIKFQIFPIFIFWVMVIFVMSSPQFSTTFSQVEN